MNRLMVKPMPHANETPTSRAQVTSGGNLTHPDRTAMPTKPTMPMGLPRNSPAMMPSVTGCIRLSMENPESESPALANANRGRIANATGTCRSCSSPRSGERPSESRMGMHSAIRTPASVAWTPELSTAIQSATPIST